MTTTQKIICYGNDFVVLEGNTIKYRLKDEDIKGLEQKIDEIIKAEKIRPVLILKKAIESITQMNFCISPKISNEQYSIHEQEIYKKYRDKIISNQIFIKRTLNENKKSLEEKKNRKNHREMECFFYDRHFKIFKALGIRK